MYPTGVHIFSGYQFFRTLGFTKQILFILRENKIRDLFKVKLYAMSSETKREREKKVRERQREIARLQIFINPNNDRGS